MKYVDESGCQGAKIATSPFCMEHSSKKPFSTRFSAFRRVILPVAITLQVCLALSGCFRDANARKQKFVVEGDRYITQEKFPEALLTYGRALQIDSESAEIH